MLSSIRTIPFSRESNDVIKVVTFSNFFITVSFMHRLGHALNVQSTCKSMVLLCANCERFNNIDISAELCQSFTPYHYTL